MATYTYNKLNAQRREIRLCTIFPASFDEPVVCDLTIVSLDDKPSYETLSYAWGSPIFNKEIVINGRTDSISHDSRILQGFNNGRIASRWSAPDSTLNVTTNLHAAFRYLRKNDQMRVVRTF